MVRGKVEVARIENATRRQVTFSKRRMGFLKKAHELSVLCDAQVALIIFSQKGKLYEFSNSNIDQVIERYRQRVKETRVNIEDSAQNIEHLKQETHMIAKRIELLQDAQRKLLGQSLGSCSLEELHEIDNQLETTLNSIRNRKAQVYKEKVENLKAQEKHLLQENATLREKCAIWKDHQPQTTQQKEIVEREQSCRVETDLFIGLPAASRWS
ncbi:unnamed protein product [Cuscuta europaea]|uniref:Uncharacterized protein n=1 Tax=Cuscuta europaea TaxID=41803 RepID=A0A9P1EDU8_CUSEU|nr:unnamed protein product [Cuscuta europaea]